MSRSRLIGAALLVAAVLTARVSSADELPPAAQWMPAGALVAVEVSGTADLLDLALSDGMVDTVSAMPPVQQKKQDGGLDQFKTIVGYFEANLGTDWKTAARTLLGGGATLALYPDKTVLLIVDGKDAALLEKLREFTTTVAKGEAAKKGNADSIRSGEYRGVTGWTFGDKEAHAVVGSRLIVANKSDALKRVVDLREDGGAALAGQAE